MEHIALLCLCLTVQLQIGKKMKHEFFKKALVHEKKVVAHKSSRFDSPVILRNQPSKRRVVDLIQTGKGFL